jgi:signal transduction histidine kinase
MMLRRPFALTLRGKLVLLFIALVLWLAPYVLWYVPSRIEASMLSAARDRAMTIAGTLSTAAAPALEFDDAENGGELLAQLAATPEARYAEIARPDGSKVAVWRRAGGAADTDLLHVTVPIQARVGDEGYGSLAVDFSLATVRAQVRATREQAATGLVLVAAVGLGLCMAVGFFIVRPIQRVTGVAHRVAEGDRTAIAELPIRRRDEVGRMARAINRMVDQLTAVNRALLDASRQAGMAEMATGILHNVGNVLNSVNVSVAVARERLDASQVARLRKGAELLAAAAQEDTRAKLVTYFTRLADHMEGERRDYAGDLDGLAKHIEHIKSVVRMQNRFARLLSVAEVVEPGAVIQEARALLDGSLDRHGVTLTVDTAGCGPARMDRHRMIQILVNLMSNAKDALAEREGERRIDVTARVEEGRLLIRVKDTGLGIAAADQTRIFSPGFTTKKNGHGYGLHSSALAASEMGGELTCHSDGIGCGATFTLALPWAPPSLERAA